MSDKAVFIPQLGIDRFFPLKSKVISQRRLAQEIISRHVILNEMKDLGRLGCEPSSWQPDTPRILRRCGYLSMTWVVLGSSG